MVFQCIWVWWRGPCESWEGVFFLSPRINSKFEKTHTHTWHAQLGISISNLDNLDIPWKNPKPSHLDSTNFPSRFQVVAAFQVKPGGDASELHAAVRGLRSFWVVGGPLPNTLYWSMYYSFQKDHKGLRISSPTRQVKGFYTCWPFLWYLQYIKSSPFKMTFGPEATLLAQLVGSKSAKIAQLSVVRKFPETGLFASSRWKSLSNWRSRGWDTS